MAPTDNRQPAGNGERTIGDELAEKAKKELDGLTQQAKRTRNHAIIWLFTTVKGWLIVLSLLVFAVLWLKTGFWVAIVALAVAWMGGWMLIKRYNKKKE